MDRRKFRPFHASSTRIQRINAFKHVGSLPVRPTGPPNMGYTAARRWKIVAFKLWIDPTGKLCSMIVWTGDDGNFFFAFAGYCLFLDKPLTSTVTRQGTH